ncbi:MAG: hypothetical protein CMM61_09595 [Rhodospirillaceae bacterium]|nr:hypothetical protein [Rhodospirillaceae bacterium]
MAKRDFRTDVAEEMIRQIEAGTAPWQKPWEPGKFRLAPHNPVSGTDYRGINAWWLDLQGREDPRWLTYRQAANEGYQVRKGEKATWVEYWQWTDREPVRDEDGNQLVDEEGKKRFRDVRLDRPKVFYAAVFNGEQIEGLEPHLVPAPDWRPDERAEEMIQAAGVPVYYDQADAAFYQPKADEIHMPPAAAFPAKYDFYATALHELGHATGNENRLAREFGPFGSEVYAKEELRAEMASFMVTTEIGLGHYPERHAGYVENWLEALKKDKNLLFQAARDAELARAWLMEPERRPELEKQAALRREASKTETKEMTNEVKQDAGKAKTYIAVPFEEKDEAKALGARWDRKEKSWYVPAGIDATAFAKWDVTQAQEAAAARDPIAEFSDACRAHGLLIQGVAQMDGRWHRVPVEGDEKGQVSGSYRGFLDGRPAGLIMNYKTGDDAPVKWIAEGDKLAPEKLEELKKQSAERKKAQAAEREKKHEATAKRAVEMFASGKPADAYHPYLAGKDVGAYEVRQKEDGTLLVPMFDRNGELRNLQMVKADGTKRYLKDGQKAGLRNEIGMNKPGRIHIAEGYATAATVHRLTGEPSVIAFDAGNIETVAAEVQKQHPEREVVIVADNDWSKKRNAGIERGLAAAFNLDTKVVYPTLDAEERRAGVTDINDVAREYGEARAAADLADLKDPDSKAIVQHLGRGQYDHVRQVIDAGRELRDGRARERNTGRERTQGRAAAKEQKQSHGMAL